MQSLYHVDLRGYHTLAAPLFADTLVLIEADGELSALPDEAVIIGRGSNIIFADDIHVPLARLVTQGWQVVREDDEYVYVSVKGGHEWHDFVVQSVRQGWQGLENLALIPGTVGAAPVQNIGAYGVEAGHFIDSVDVYDRTTAQMSRIPAAACGFAYRNSHFKGQWRNRYVITAVTFRLNKVPQLCLGYVGLAGQGERLNSAQAVMEEVIAIRSGKLPDPALFPNAGSFFHNPVVDGAHWQTLHERHPHMPAHAVADGMKIPAAWLIEQAGLKGYCDGALCVSPQHALVLVNQGGSGRDILRFAAFVQERVRERFAIDLQIEPIVIGDVAYAA